MALTACPFWNAFEARRCVCCSTSASAAVSGELSTPGRTRARLQAALVQAGIDYEHHIELAPTTELRQLQYAEDDRRGVGKRTRRELAVEYARRYTTEILDRADLTPILSALSSRGTAALLCVERDPEACHRSLIAQRLTEQHGVTIEHLCPLSSMSSSD